MTDLNKPKFEYFEELVSIFDLSSALPEINFSEGLESDYQKLTNDLKTLEEDYKNARRKVELEFKEPKNEYIREKTRESS